jgi:hypothetical protein
VSKKAPISHKKASSKRFPRARGPAQRARRDKPLRAWRVCRGRKFEDGYYVESLYPSGEPPVFVRLGLLLRSGGKAGGVYVGTRRKFCEQYYTGMFDPEVDECELLLHLRVDPRKLTEQQRDAWTWKCGTEAQVRAPRVHGITVLRRGPRGGDDACGEDE